MVKEYMTWTLRHVPNSTRGEFVNIGVLVGGLEDDWAIRFVTNFRRANRLGGSAEKLLPILKKIAASLPGEVVTGPRGEIDLFENGPQWSVSDVEYLRKHRQNALQISEPRPTYGESADSLADFLYGHLVLEHVGEPAQRALTRMRKRYEHALDVEIPTGLHYAKHVYANFEHRNEVFDFAVHGDHNVRQLTHAINFRNQGERRMRDAVDALTHRFTLIREGGADIQLSRDGHVLPFNRDNRLFVVHNEPLEKPQAQIFTNAQRAWQKIGIESVFEEELVDHPERAIAA